MLVKISHLKNPSTFLYISNRRKTFVSKYFKLNYRKLALIRQFWIKEQHNTFCIFLFTILYTFKTSDKQAKVKQNRDKNITIHLLTNQSSPFAAHFSGCKWHFITTLDYTSSRNRQFFISGLTVHSVRACCKRRESHC